MTKEKDKKSYLYNSWRGFKFTAKGKNIGYSGDWNEYLNFYNDMVDSYERGMVLNRLNKELPFSKENCIWTLPQTAAFTKPFALKLEYNGENKTISEWAILYNIPVRGILHRLRKHKDDSSENIIFGKQHLRKREITDINDLSEQRQKDKISKMLSSYRIKDIRKKFENDLTFDWVRDNIFYENCFYCGTDKKIGCDRIDNSKGHTVDNVVPCCYRCNVVRADYYTVDEMKIIGKTLIEIENNRLKKSA